MRSPPLTNPARVDSALDYEFHPRPIPTAIATIAALAFLALGVWQTVRFFEKTNVELLQRQRSDLPVQQLTEASLLADPNNDYRVVEVDAAIAPSPAFMVAYRRHLGHQGCWVANPMTLADGSVVLAVRGFVIESSPGKCEPPPVPPAATWRALINTPPTNPIDPAARAAAPADATIWQTFDIAGMYHKLDNPARPARVTGVIQHPSHRAPPPQFAGGEGHETEPPDRTPIEFVRDMKPMYEEDAVALLGRFLFRYDQMRQPVGTLSGERGGSPGAGTPGRARSLPGPWRAICRHPALVPGLPRRLLTGDGSRPGHQSTPTGRTRRRRS